MRSSVTRADASSHAADDSGRWRALTGIAVGALLSMSTWFSGTAVLGALRAEWRLSGAAGSWLTSAVQLGFVAGSLTASLTNLLDIVAPRRFFLWASLVAALANTLFAFAPGPV